MDETSANGVEAPSQREGSKPLGAMLRLAIQAGSKPAILARLRSGDAVHARDHQGRTPLMLAALRGHLEVCGALLDHDADASAVDLQGNTALDLARDAGHQAVVEMLSDCSGASAGANSRHPPSRSDDSLAGAGKDPVDEDVAGWEPEILEIAPEQDDSCVAAAAWLQEAMRAHSVVDRDEDWGDVDVDLPSPLATGGRVVLDQPTKALLRHVFAEATGAGWINAEQLLDLMCGSRSNATDTELEIERKSLQCLTDHGVVVDDESWPWPSPDYVEHDDGGESDEIETMLVDVEHSISPRHDPLWSFARDLRHAGPLLDHVGEIRLGSALQDGIRRAVLALCSDGQAAAVLLSAIEKRAMHRQVEPASSEIDSAASDADLLDVVRSPDLKALDAINGDGRDQSSVDGPVIDLVRSAAATVASLRLAVEQQILSGDPGADKAVQRLVRESIVGTGLGVVQLVELRESLPLNEIASSAREAFREGLQAAVHARDRLVRCNLRLVWSIARKYTFSGIPLLDLIQDGSIGLMRAVDRYDHTRGFRFSTYATWWIRQSVSRSVADSSRTIRVPVHMFERVRNVERAAEMMQLRLGRDPGIDEMAAELNLTASEIEKTLRVPCEPSSTDDPANADWPDQIDLSLTDTVSPDDRLELTQLRDWVISTVDSLKPKEALILRMRYGLGTEHEYTLEEVGLAMDVTRERIRQIEKKAMKLLKQRLERECIGAISQKSQGKLDSENPEEDQEEPPPIRPEREATLKFAELAPTLPIDKAIEAATASSSRRIRSVSHALKLLASSQTQRGIAASLDVPSFQREFAHRWFQAYSAVDPDGTFTAVQHGQFQRVSAELRKALRLLGFERLEIGELLCDPGWQDVMKAASSALRQLADE